MNLSSIFEGKALGLKPKEIVEGALEVERKAIQKLPSTQLDILGLKRTKKQKGLNPLGDWDKDKKLNIFDCEPYNKKKQGYIDKTINLIKGHGFVENQNIQPFRTVVEGDAEALKKVAHATGRGVVATSRGVVTGAQATGRGVSNIYKASGAPEYFQRRTEQKDWEREMTRTARAEALKYAGKLKAEKLVKFETEKAVGVEPVPPARVGEVRGAVGAAVSPFAPTGYEDKVSRMMGFGGGYGGGMHQAVQMVGGGRQASFPTKVQEAVGGRGAPIAPSSIPMEPIQSAQPFMPLETPQLAHAPGEGPEMGQPPQPGMVWSVKSKKYVKYTRHPYRRHPQVQQPLGQVSPPTPPPSAPPSAPMY